MRVKTNIIRGYIFYTVYQIYQSIIRRIYFSVLNFKLKRRLFILFKHDSLFDFLFAVLAQIISYDRL